MSQSLAASTRRFDDAPWSRLPWLTGAAVVLTALSLMGFLRLLDGPLATMPAPAPVRVDVVEVPTTIQTPPTPAPSPQIAPSRPAAPRQPEPVRRPAPEPAPSPESRDAAVEAPPPLAPVPQTEASREQIARPAPLPSPSVAAPRAAPGGSASPSSAAAPPGGGQMGARALYKPMPEIPESLRRRTIDVVALARFRVAADGSAQVDLVEPTSEPDLNRALLEALRRWRFFPAMQDGKPVASSVDIRIPVSVR